MVIEWTDVASEYVGVSANSGSTVAVCRFPAADGRAEIPPEVLQLMPPGSGSVSIYGSSGPSQLAAGEWTVNVEAVFTAVWPDGTSASFSATFQ